MWGSNVLLLHRQETEALRVSSLSGAKLDSEFRCSTLRSPRKFLQGLRQDVNLTLALEPSRRGEDLRGQPVHLPDICRALTVGQVQDQRSQLSGHTLKLIIMTAYRKECSGRRAWSKGRELVRRAAPGGSDPGLGLRGELDKKRKGGRV